MAVFSKLKHAWNAFMNVDAPKIEPFLGVSTGSRPHRSYRTVQNDKTIATAIYNRIAIDVSAVLIKHVRTDEKGRYLSDMPSSLNNCLTVEPNIDQAPRAFRQNIAMAMLVDGIAAVVPVDTTFNPHQTESFDIKSMRVGSVVEFFPTYVRVSLYNEKRGTREDIPLPKATTAIITNPLYDVMNLPNSTMQRLIRKLSLLDAVEEQAGSGKLDIIIQMPYVIKSDSMRIKAEQRRKDIEMQMKDSQYGVAYADGTEKIIQLNRPAENNLLNTIEFLVKMLYGELGITDEVMNGTADEKTMLNYNNRTVLPIVDAIVEEMRRSFLTRTARSQRQSIKYFTNPFSLLPIGEIAEIADKFTRNEIASSNEIRDVVGLPPSQEPKADELRNSNMPQSELGPQLPPPIQVEASRLDRPS